MSDIVLDYSGEELNNAIRDFKANYKNTSDGNITKEGVLAGQVGYNAEGKVIGEMPDNGAVNLQIDGITKTSSTIPKGYHNGEGSVKLTDDIANEVDSQSNIISQIKSVLQGKAAGSSVPENAAIVFEYHTEGDYIGEIKKIAINRSTELPPNMFSDNKVPNKYYNYVEEVELNDDIEKIGQLAFGRMASLKRVKLPASVVTIDSAAFTSCPLENLTFPETLETIGSYCFERGNFEKLIFPLSIISINSCAFQACKKLKIVCFNGTPTLIANNTFTSGTTVENIYCPWSEGEVANAPWGATSATIHYNTQYDADGNPITT